MRELNQIDFSSILFYEMLLRRTDWSRHSRVICLLRHENTETDHFWNNTKDIFFSFRQPVQSFMKLSILGVKTLLTVWFDSVVSLTARPGLDSSLKKNNETRPLSQDAASLAGNLFSSSVEIMRDWSTNTQCNFLLERPVSSALAAAELSEEVTKKIKSEMQPRPSEITRWFCTNWNDWNWCKPCSLFHKTWLFSFPPFQTCIRPFLQPGYGDFSLSLCLGLTGGMAFFLLCDKHT